jgi:hypothetical protein
MAVIEGNDGRDGCMGWMVVVMGGMMEGLMFDVWVTPGLIAASCIE